MRNMADLATIGDGAKLTESENLSSGTKPKYFKSVPISYEERFNKLKELGKVNGTFTSFCLDSIGTNLTIQERN